MKSDLADKSLQVRSIDRESAQAEPGTRSFVVITPVLNGARFIGKTLKSISAQSDPSWTHYVVDGGSTDSTKEIVRESVHRDPRCRLIEGRDGGMYDAIFKGFDAAASDGKLSPDTICLWLNSDDQLMPWAFATLRKAFDDSNAEWILTLPSFWDAEGRLAYIIPYVWHARSLIRIGLFHGRALGWIQQESTFFTWSLLGRVAPELIAAIRRKRLAGDFLLWQEFARHCAPTVWPTAVSGFRVHEDNASSRLHEEYYRELRSNGVFIPPKWIGLLMRLAYRPLAVLHSIRNVRNRSRAFAAEQTKDSTKNC